MLEFKKFISLSELIKRVSSESLSISRAEMPQIASDDLEDFFEYLTKNNVLHFVKHIVPTSCKATQNEFNISKIETLIDKKEDFDIMFSNPVLVSNDCYIIDGHHRWLANIHLDIKQMKVTEIDLPIEDCLNIIRQYDKVFYKTIKESININD